MVQKPGNPLLDKHVGGQNECEEFEGSLDNEMDKFSQDGLDVLMQESEHFAGRAEPLIFPRKQNADGNKTVINPLEGGCDASDDIEEFSTKFIDSDSKAFYINDEKISGTDNEQIRQDNSFKDSRKCSGTVVQAYSNANVANAAHQKKGHTDKEIIEHLKMRIKEDEGNLLKFLHNKDSNKFRYQQNTLTASL